MNTLPPVQPPSLLETLSAQFLLACLRKSDTIWTVKPANWADKVTYHPTLSVIFLRWHGILGAESHFGQG